MVSDGCYYLRVDDKATLWGQPATLVIRGSLVDRMMISQSGAPFPGRAFDDPLHRAVQSPNVLTSDLIHISCSYD